MTSEEIVLFLYLRRTVYEYIKDYLKDDGDHKSYEGAWELLTCYPSYFDSETFYDGPEAVVATLHCYVLGPSRHYEWRGRTWKEAFEKAKRDIEEWAFLDEGGDAE